MIIEPTLARNTGRGPRDKPSMRVTGRRTSIRQPKKPGVSVIGDIGGQNFNLLCGPNLDELTLFSLTIYALRGFPGFPSEIGKLAVLADPSL